MFIRARAPLRLGLAGGGTDVSPYCDQFGGYVLNTTIDRYANCIIEPRNDQRLVFSMADSNLSEEHVSQPQIEIDGPFRLLKGVYNRVVRQFNNGEPLSATITTYSDAPIGSGLGSSSTMVVAILACFAEWLDIPLGEYDLAHIAYEIERVELALEGGKQDQYAAAFGGTNFMEFNANHHVVVNPLRIKERILDELEASLLVYYSGVSRESSKIIRQQIARSMDNDVEYIKIMDQLKADALRMKEALLRGRLNLFSEILGRSWKSKKNIAQGVSNSEMDQVYDIVMNHGAISGKISGAGGGGVMMFIVDPTRRCDVERALEQLPGSVLNCHFVGKGAIAWISDALHARKGNV